MTDLADRRSEFRRINSAILQFLLDGEKGRNQVATDVSRMAGVPVSASALLVIERLRPGSMRVNDLGASVGITSGGITRQVQDLEAKGLIEKKPDETDGRAALVGLSSKGVDVVRLADVIRDFSTRRALGEWEDEDVERVAPLLERLADGLRRGAAGASVFDIIPFELNTPVDEWVRLTEGEG
jgi:DNA-binding MarR family transcriptional regulator